MGAAISFCKDEKYLKMLDELSKLTKKHHTHVLVELVDNKEWKTDAEMLIELEKFTKN